MRRGMLLRFAQDDSSRATIRSPNPATPTTPKFEVRNRRARAPNAFYGGATPTSACLTVRSRCSHHRRMPCDTSRPPSSSPPSSAAARTFRSPSHPSRISPNSRPRNTPSPGSARSAARRAEAWPSTPRAGWPAGPTSPTAPGARRSGRTGSLIPIGTLGGPSSTVPWPGLNDAGHGRRHLPDRRVGPAARGLELRAGRLPARDHRPHLPRLRLAERRDPGAAPARRPSQLRHRRQQPGRRRRMGGDGRARSDLRGRPGAPVPRGRCGIRRTGAKARSRRASCARSATTRRRPPRRSTTRARWSASPAIATRPSAASAPSTRCSGSRTAS